MSAGKLYIGRKVREIREANKVTQSAFAERLGISTSYLNQIENNQRPVSASVLLALAEKFQINIASITSGDDDRLLSALVEALVDPIFDGYTPSHQELKLIVQNAPGFAHSLIASHQAYRRNSEQLASFDHQLGRSSSLTEPSPYEEVRDFFHFVDNYIHDLDVSAERLAAQLDLPERNAESAIADYLDREHGIRIMRAPPGDDLLRRYDPDPRVLFVNSYSPSATRTFQMAYQIADLEQQAEIDRVIADADFRTPEAAEICRIGLQNYFAGALILPYQLFMAAAKEQRHDLDLLAVRFGASLEQVAHRLSTLQRPGLKGTPVFFATIDRAGNITKRHSAAKLQFARFGSACPLWNAHQAFEAPGRIIRQLAETPDGVRYLSVATEVNKSVGGYRAPHRRYAIALGCEISYANDFVYADGLDLGNRNVFEPIGISCRICERTNCPQRAVPPVKAKLTFHPLSRSIQPYIIP